MIRANQLDTGSTEHTLPPIEKVFHDLMLTASFVVPLSLAFIVLLPVALLFAVAQVVLISLFVSLVLSTLLPAILLAGLLAVIIFSLRKSSVRTKRKRDCHV